MAAVAPVALTVMPVLAEIAPVRATGVAVELVVLVIVTAPRLELIAPAPTMPLCAVLVAVCNELLVMVTPAEPETAAPMFNPSTPLTVRAALEALESVIKPVVEVKAEVTDRCACAKAAADELVLMLRLP